MVRQAIPTVSEALDVALANHEDRSVRLEARFDRTYLDLYLHYRGAPIELPDAPPDPDELADQDIHLSRLSGYFIRLAATEVRSTSKGEEQIQNIRFAHQVGQSRR